MAEVIKRVANAVLFDDGTIRVDNVRASHPHLTTPYSKVDPKTGKAGTPKYSITGIMPKDTHRAAKDLIKSVIDEILAEKHKDGKGLVLKMKGENKFLRDGDLGDKPEYEGAFTVSASEINPPALRGKGKERLSVADANRLIYGGCYVSMRFRPWYQNNEWGKRMNAGLVAVQFMDEGEPFGQGRISDDDVDDGFDSYDDDDDNDTRSPGRRPAVDDEDEI